MHATATVAASQAPGKKGGALLSGSLRMAMPLRGGGKRSTHKLRQSPLKALCEQAEDQWKHARAAARWGLRDSQATSPPGAPEVQ